MSSEAREYIDFWVENSVHAREQYRGAGASQDVTGLVSRLVDGARAQGISEAAMLAEVGDLNKYVRGKLADANKIEQDRSK